MDREQKRVPSTITFVGAVTAEQDGGATIKNRLIVQQLHQRGVGVDVIDTGKLRGRGMWRLIAIASRTASKTQVLFSLSPVGSVVLVTLMYLLQSLRSGKRHALMAVGSGLPTMINRLRQPLKVMFLRSLARCDAVYVESRVLQAQLEEAGLSNIVHLQNPRNRAARMWRASTDERQHIIFLSRLTESKGVLDAVSAVAQLRREGLDLELDIYGPIDPSFASKFQDALKATDGSRYRGVADPSKITDLLVDYDALVFPTYWPSEGMAGVLVEAAMVGMPVVSSKFPGVEELVEDGVSGLLVDARDIPALAAAVKELLTDPPLVDRLTRDLARRAESYVADAVVEALQTDLRSRGWQ